MTLAIRTAQLTKVYRTGFWMRPVSGLKSLDIEVREGEIFGFVGPNGAGKTTTIKILVGLHRATTGSAEIFGIPVQDAQSRASLGFLPERPYFYQHLSPRELLEFHGRLCQLESSHVGRRSAALLERVGLSRFADVPLRKFSKGMLQRVGLCQALLHEPKVLILDEPMSGLDPLGRALVREIILEERERGRTVFFSSHILHDVETLCDRVSILVQGELRAIGDTKTLLVDQSLEQMLIEEVNRQGPVDPKRLGVLA
jgi:ABC-2 type transport system ATP-binding protein